jgi:xylulokinase
LKLFGFEFFLNCSFHLNKGRISTYWCKKFGFSAECEIFAFSGDNPCSLIGLDLNKPGELGISLGTSDVIFAVTAEPKPNPDEGSILIHPSDFHAYMIMLVYKNGSTTRKHVKDFVSRADVDWSKFNEILDKTPVGNNGCISFYYLVSVFSWYKFLAAQIICCIKN